MSLFLSITLLVLLVAASVGLYLYVRRRKRQEIIALLTEGVDLLAKWSYSPAEWRRAVAEEFTWASHNDYAGQVFISPTALYVRTDHHDHLIDLADKGKVVTHASYRGADESPLKLRVRWKVITVDPDGGEEVNYYKEDYRIPVPRGAKDAATKVADFFTRKMESNLSAYTDVVGDDEPISLFGRDSF